MSNLQRLSNMAFKIREVLNKKGFDVSGKGKKPNEILVEFLKEKNLKYEKWNPRYKGLFTAELVNAKIIFDNIDLFNEWLLNKKLL